MWIRNRHRALLLVVACGPLGPRGTAEDGATPERADALISNLQAKSVDVRRNAASRLRFSAKSVQQKALPVLIDLLMKEKDGQVRLAVFDSVTALGADARSAVPALLHTLRTKYGGDAREESHQDYRAALALAAVGQHAVEGLRGLLKEQKENVRAEAVMGLGRIGPAAGAAIPDLIPLLGDKSDRIGREASLALGRIGTAALEPLCAASAHENAVIRERAVASLGYLPVANDQVHRAVFKCAHDRAPEVRAAAVKSLARFDLPDDALLPVLKENLRHEDERVRLATVNLLVARRTLLGHMMSDLESLLTAKNVGVSHHAAFLLCKTGPQAAPGLLRALHQEDSRIDQVALALAQIGRPIVELLAQAIKAPDPRVRRGAALALGQIRPLPEGTARKLTVGLQDPDREVKAAFLTAIGYLGPRAHESVPAVRAMLKDESAKIRIQAVAILSQSAPRDERLVGDLEALFDDPDAQVQREAIDMIRSIGPPGRHALTVVIGKLHSSDPEVRIAAAQLIGSHGQAAAEAVPALSALLDEKAPRIRTIAAQTLGKLGTAAQPAFPRSTSLLGAEQVEVREAAVTALGSLELDALAIRPPLARALRDDKSEVRRAATRAIQKLGPQGAIFVPDIILLAANKDSQRSAERLLRRFERIGPDVRSLPDLVKQLQHDKDSVRLLAIKFLGLAGGNAKNAIPALERMRDDPSAEVRKQAEAAIEQIKKNTGATQQKDRTAKKGTAG